MGNSPSAEANRNAFLSDPSTQNSQQHHHHPMHIPSLHPPPEQSSNQNRLSKPRTRRQSTTGLSRSKPDGLASSSTSRPRRSLTLGASASPVKAAQDDDQPLSYPAPESPAIFTFEEAVVSVAGHRASGYWAPIAPAFDIDIQHLQEQQSRQQDSHQNPDDEDMLELKTPKHKSRKRDSILRSLSLHRPMRRHHEHQSSRRRNSIASEYPSDEWRPADGASVAYDQAAAEYYGSSAPADNWSPRAGSHASWNYNLSSYEAKRLLHIVDGDNPVDYQLELTSAVSEGRVPALLGVRSSLPAPSRDESIIRVHSDLSLYAPMRRRSMLQIPGVATRVSTGSAVTMAGPSNFPQSLPATPGLSHQASFESVQSCTLSTPPLPSLPPLVRPNIPARQQSEPAPRASTPCDNDYQAIGAFKLGTLRITNGVASPMSSPERIKTDDDSEDLGGFNFAARTEALAILTGASRTQNSHSTEHTTYDPFMDHQTADGRLLPPPSPMEQPLSPLTTASVGSFGMPNSSKRTSVIELPQIELPDDIFDGFEFNLFIMDDAAPAETETQAPLSPGLLQPTSKRTATEDKLFEDDESESSEYVTREVLDVRLDPNAKSTATYPAVTTGATTTTTTTATTTTTSSKKKSTRSSRSMRSITRSDSGFVSSPASESSHHKPLSKADSGYSSNMSMRSFKQAAHKLMAPVAAVKAATLSPPEKNGSLGTRNSPQRESFYIGELKLPGPSLHAEGSDLLSPMAALYSLDTRYTRPLPPLPRPSPSSKATPPPPIQTSLHAPRRKAPPPPPPKDLPPVPLTPSIPPTTHTGQSPASTPLRKLSRKRYTMSMALLGAQHSPAPVNDSSALATPSSIGSDSLDSTSNTATKSAQKPGRLSRFFNLGAAGHNKGMPPVPATRVVEVADVLPVPQEAYDQLHDHLGRLPPTTRRVALRTQLSRDTLKTIFSVGSLEARSALEPHVDVATRAPGAAAEEKKKEEGTRHEHQSWRRRRYTLQSPPLSPAGAEAAPRRTLTRRKSRLRPEGSEGGKTNSSGNDVMHTASRPSSASRSAAKRAMSLTAQLEHGLNVKRSFSRAVRPPMADEQDADPSRVDLPAEQYQVSTAAAEAPADAWMTTQQQRHPQFLPCVPSSQQLQRPQTTPSLSGSWGSTALQYWASFENSDNQEISSGNTSPQASNMQHGYHQRNRSTGDRNGPQGPFRILHSYDSPAYRGVPIWG